MSNGAWDPGRQLRVLVFPGIEDLRRGIESVPALLVSIGRPRLERLLPGLPPRRFDTPEHRLYLLLAAEHGDEAHCRYNALLRRLVSFERAAECATGTSPWFWFRRRVEELVAGAPGALS